MYTITCLVEGEGIPFPVDIDGDPLVCQLKSLIKKEKPVTLANVNPHNLKLYHVNLESDESDKQEHITHANEVLQGLTKHKPLKPLLKLSKIEEGFPDGAIHILVQLPPSESIHSRACGAFADTHPPNPQFHSMSSHLDHRECLRVFTSFTTNRSQAEAFNRSHQRSEGHQSQSHVFCEATWIL